MAQSLTLKSDLGDVLIPSSLAGGEQLGQPFNYSLRMLAKDANVDIRSLLGSSMTVTLEANDAYIRYFNGIVAEISQSGFETIENKTHAVYSARLVPKLWLLSQKLDCRIYKAMSVPDIIALVFKEMGIDSVPSLSGQYPVRDYCVQYREDYLNFVNRLMEQEGIYYFFRHTDGAHKVYLADGLGAHSATSNHGQLQYLDATGASATGAMGIQDFFLSRQVHTTSYSLEDYNPLKPKLSLLATETYGYMEDAHNLDGLKSFDYPGDHQLYADGQRYAKVKVEALSVALAQYSGTTTAISVLTGALFTLSECPRADMNQEYLVTSSTVHVSNSAPTSGSGGGGLFSCSISAIESKHPYRTMPSAVRPLVIGLQTAVVCGSKDAEDIVVDKYGRVQVVFHWNKENKDKNDVSCPVRVSTPWAGKQWGAVHIPRVGQEVVVSFLEGDPDRPLIVGSVYNADNMPPYDLPANMTQSGIKSRSHKGGAAANFNEIRFEDKMGSEELFMHAEKDMREEVENDHFVEIDHDEAVTIKNDRKHDITGFDTLTVGKDSKSTIGKTYLLDVADEITIKTGDASINMKKDGTITIKGKDITIDGSGNVTGKAGMNLSLKGAMNTDVKAGMALSVKGDISVAIEGTTQTDVKGTMLNLTGTAMAKLGGGITMIG